MKLSNYNHFYNMEDDILAYNARTNAMAVLENEDFNKLNGILKGNVCDASKLIDELTYGGFLIEDYVDELDLIRHDMYANRFSTSQLNLTIAPTSDCNFRCPYCYEKDVLHTQRMSDEVANRIVEFVKTKSTSIDQFNVTWYGGEPLLEFERIIDLSNKFMDICEKNSVKYSAGIVTNGYLLTENRLKKLIECKVSSVQITLDGVKESHDQRRYLINHGGTFDRIIANLVSLEKIAKELTNFPKISVRMNIDRNNKKEAFELLEFIANSSLGTYIVPYVANIYLPSDVNHEVTLTESEYIQLKQDFTQKSKSLGFKVDYLAFYPRRITSTCCCDRFDSAVIDAKGNMFKCWEEIGEEEACVGQIGSEETYNLPQLYYNYLLYDPTTIEGCRECKILPVCMGGGCPLRRVRDKRKNCKFQIDEFNINMQKSALSFGKKISEEVYI